MKWTNKKNLPEPICAAIRAQATSHKVPEGCYLSCTSLIGPPLIRRLKALFDDQIEVDYSDCVWLLDGSCAHETFASAADEMGDDAALISEQTFKMSFDVPNIGIVNISFKPDVVYHDGHLDDYKKTSVFKIQKIPVEGVDHTWIAQLNLYAVAANQGFMGLGNKLVKPVNKLSVWAWMRDWGPRYSKVSDTSFLEIPIPLWGTGEVINYATERIILHKQADAAADATGIAPCTPIERWCKPSDRDSKPFIPGPRCSGKRDGNGYCGVAKFCPYLKEYQEMKGGERKGEVEEL